MKCAMLMAYLPYGELSEVVEQAISRWLSTKTNVDHFENGEAHWMASINLTIEGQHRTGEFKIRMVSSQQILLSGDLVPVENTENAK